MQLFLHATCSACTLDFHLYATKMPYMYSYCCYGREKKEYSTKKCGARQKVTKLLRKTFQLYRSYIVPFPKLGTRLSPYCARSRLP
jgi:hypothetical protein